MSTTPILDPTQVASASTSTVPLPLDVTIHPKSPAPALSLPLSVSPTRDNNPKSAFNMFPVEIWRLIFVYATRVEKGSDSSYFSPFDFSELSEGYHLLLKNLNEKHRIKETLCCVCRGFHLITLELIYEYLFLRDNHDWEKLAYGLEHSNKFGVAEADHSTQVSGVAKTGATITKGAGASVSGAGQRVSVPPRRSLGPGWFVKRIDICTAEWTNERGILASRVLRCCPNLRFATFTLDRTYVSPVQIAMPLIRTLFGCCSSKLESLEWTFDVGDVQAALMLALMHKCKSLRRLTMCWHGQRESLLGMLPENAKKTELKELHSLEVVSLDVDPSTLLERLAEWRLPSLRQVVITGQIDLADAKAFFVKHGEKIRLLEFDHAGDAHGPLVPDDDGLPSRGPAMLLARCPNLEDLVLQLHWIPLQALSGHPRVTRIGIRGLMVLVLPNAPLHVRQRVFLSHLGAAFQTLVHPGRYPSLRIVRMLDFEQNCFRSLAWRTSSVAFWALWVKRFENMGMRLEDHQGEVVKLVFSEVNVLLPEDEAEEGDGDGERVGTAVSGEGLGDDLDDDLTDDPFGDYFELS